MVPTWTDERIDEKMTSIDSTYSMLHDDLSGLREETRGLRTDVSEELRGLRSDLARVQDRMIQIGFGLVASLLAALVAAILALAT